MSLLGKQWVITHPDLATFLQQTFDDGGVCFHDPFLLGDMAKAVTRVGEAIERKERILVFGDYDVDGISGTALLVKTLRELGAEVSYRLPDRQTGYGLQSRWIEEFAQLEVKVLITVDCGISNEKEIEAAKGQGIDVIVTDHHTIPGVLPLAAHALIHPSLPGGNYPFPFLSGSAVVFKLAVALMHQLRGAEAAATWRQKTVDLASLGTVADCMPLVGENRWIAMEGLRQLKQTEWEGLRILLKTAGVEITDLEGYDADLIGFRIGPRLNAAGRLDTPYYALQLLLNENGKALPLAQKLEEMNAVRKKLMEQCLQEAEAALQCAGGMERNILIAGSTEWPAGVIGLLAGRLAEKYNRPSIIFEERGEERIGSCRSIEGFSIVEALSHARDHLKTFGGHSAAAGFTITVEEFPYFQEKIEAYAAEHLKANDLKATLRVDCPVRLRDITFDLIKKLEARAPFGQGNPRPRLLVTDAKVKAFKPVGREHRHLKLRLEGGEAIAFGWGEYQEKLKGKVDMPLVVEVARRIWNGHPQIELKAVDAEV